MTVPTPRQLGQVITDLGAGYTAEIVGLGTPDPLLGQHLTTAGKRITSRVETGDERLDAFAPYTDTAGYVWLPEPVFGYLTDTANRLWSFERWFTGFADTIRTCQPVSGEELEENRAYASTIDGMAEAGFRPVEIDRAAGTAGFLFKR